MRPYGGPCDPYVVIQVVCDIKRMYRRKERPWKMCEFTTQVFQFDDIQRSQGTARKQAARGKNRDVFKKITPMIEGRKKPKKNGRRVFTLSVR